MADFLFSAQELETATRLGLTFTQVIMRDNRCAQCGHIGCCDNSPGQHATAHAEATGHPLISSFEPGEDCFYDYRDQQLYDGPRLAPPQHHPLDQPTPGPAGRVPPDWPQRLH